MTLLLSVQRAAAAAGLEIKAHPHVLRHACGFKLGNDRVNARSLQAYLGHKNIQHTVRYTEKISGAIKLSLVPWTTWRSYFFRWAARRPSARQFQDCTLRSASQRPGAPKGRHLARP
jgi:integrase